METKSEFPRSGKNYIENPSECPFCGSDNIDGGIDNSFEGDTMISGGCVCRECGKRWAESYTLDGWIEHVEDGPDVYHAGPDFAGVNRDLVKASQKVLDSWEGGNLAAAVRELSVALAKARGEVER